MPDDNKGNGSKSSGYWPNQFARDFMQILTIVVLFYTADKGRENRNISQANHDLSQENHERINNVDSLVEKRSKEVLDKQDTTVKETKAAAKEVKEKLAMDDEERAIVLGSQLYGNWRYLQDRAELPDATTKDQEQADKAKKVYNDHVAKHRKP
jgi:hypothetical protein